MTNYKLRPRDETSFRKFLRDAIPNMSAELETGIVSYVREKFGEQAFAQNDQYTDIVDRYMECRPEAEFERSALGVSTFDSGESYRIESEGSGPYPYESFTP